MNEKVQTQNIEITKDNVSTYHETGCKYRIQNYNKIFSKGDPPTKQLH